MYTTLSEQNDAQNYAELGHWPDEFVSPISMVRAVPWVGGRVVFERTVGAIGAGGRVVFERTVGAIGRVFEWTVGAIGATT